MVKKADEGAEEGVEADAEGVREARAVFRLGNFRGGAENFGGVGGLGSLGSLGRGGSGGTSSEDERATGDGVDRFSLPKGKDGGITDGAGFATVFVANAGTVGEVFDEDKMIFPRETLNWSDFDRDAEIVLYDDGDGGRMLLEGGF